MRKFEEEEENRKREKTCTKKIKEWKKVELSKQEDVFVKFLVAVRVFYSRLMENWFFIPWRKSSHIFRRQKAQKSRQLITEAGRDWVIFGPDFE